MPKPPPYEFDIWYIACLICDERLDVEGIRPPAGVILTHMKVHNIDYRTCFSNVDGYSTESETDANGFYTSSTTVIVSTDEGNGIPATIAVRQHGYQKPRSGPYKDYEY